MGVRINGFTSIIIEKYNLFCVFYPPEKLIPIIFYFYNSTSECKKMRKNELSTGGKKQKGLNYS